MSSFTPNTEKVMKIYFMSMVFVVLSALALVGFVLSPLVAGYYIYRLRKQNLLLPEMYAAGAKAAIIGVIAGVGYAFLLSALSYNASGDPLSGLYMIAAPLFATVFGLFAHQAVTVIQVQKRYKGSPKPVKLYLIILAVLYAFLIGLNIMLTRA